MEAKVHSSVIQSIFRRKGGEGVYTKIINDENITDYSNVLTLLPEDEKGLIIFFEGIENWLLLTEKRTLSLKNKTYSSIFHTDLVEVSMDIQEEFRNGIKDKNAFTRLLAVDINNKTHLLKIENGQPYHGVYQILHFLAPI